MGNKREIRRCRQAEQLKELVAQYNVSDEEFAEITDRVMVNKLTRLDPSVKLRIRKLYNSLVYN